MTQRDITVLHQTMLDCVNNFNFKNKISNLEKERIINVIDKSNENIHYVEANIQTPELDSMIISICIVITKCDTFAKKHEKLKEIYDLLHNREKNTSSKQDIYGVHINNNIIYVFKELLKTRKKHIIKNENELIAKKIKCDNLTNEQKILALEFACETSILLKNINNVYIYFESRLGDNINEWFKLVQHHLSMTYQINVTTNITEAKYVIVGFNGKFPLIIPSFKNDHKFIILQFGGNAKNITESYRDHLFDMEGLF